MSGVSKVCAREIFDSRGNPTVEVDITTSKGKYFFVVDSSIMAVVEVSFSIFLDKTWA